MPDHFDDELQAMLVQQRAKIDQGKAGTDDLAAMVVRFHSTLIAGEVDRVVAGEMSRDFLEAMLAPQSPYEDD